MDYSFLQHYWWFIISLLGALLVFLLFVQGGQTLIYIIARSETEKSMLINSLGRKWEFTFTTLVTFGGAFFASFPLFYSTSFGGAYWVWMTILLCFVLQAVAYEFRIKSGNLLGQRVYEIFLLINGFGGVILLGTAVGTLFSGAEFLIDKGGIADLSMPVISRWMHPALGLEAALNPRNILLGISLVWLARSVASLYFINNIDNEEIVVRSRHQLFVDSLLFVLFFLTFLTLTFMADGFAVDAESGLIVMEKYKYFYNFIDMPVVGAALLIGVALYLFGVVKSLLVVRFTKGVWFSGVGVILVVLALLLSVGYNNTAYYPSLYDLQSSLTIANSSSSAVTLELMSYASLLIPFVAAYIFYVWRAMDRTPITREEIEKSDHIY